MTFLFDENISPDICAALKALKKPVEHVLDVPELGRETPDERTFAFLAEHEDWFLITQDKKMGRKKHQRAAMRQAVVGAFIFTGKAEKSNDEFMVLILRVWPEIERRAAGMQRPFIVGISDRHVFDEM